VLARAGYRLLLPARDSGRGQATADELRRGVPGAAVEVFPVDLGEMAEVEAFAQVLLRRGEPLDVLLNNAGVWLPTRQRTREGRERTWATNVLAYYLLTERLRPLLHQAGGRVVSVASELAGDLRLDDLDFSQRGYAGLAAYKQSKQANRMLSHAWAQRGVTHLVCHPGGVTSGIVREAQGLFGWVVRLGNRLLGSSPEQGADTPVWLATVPAAPDGGGLYVDRGLRPCEFVDHPDTDALWAAVRADLGLSPDE
jgi:NAD(P)-dependent dehydrogenase (short-subunit alcohol dehydrogenase family)